MSTARSRLAVFGLVSLASMALAARAMAEDAKTLSCSPDSDKAEHLKCEPSEGKLEKDFSLVLFSDRCADPAGATLTVSPKDVQCTGPADAKPGLKWSCQGQAGGVAVESLEVQISCAQGAGPAFVSKMVKGEKKPADKPGDKPEPALSELPEGAWRKALHAARVPLDGARLGNYYSRKDDVAVLFFNSAGAPFFPIPDVIDEDDDIYVVVVDDEDLLKGTQIALNGCNRPPVQPRVYAPAGAATRALEEVGKERVLRHVIRAFGKCAGAESGGPQVSIGGQNTTIPVNPLYRFAVGVAAAYDNTSVRAYSLRTPPGEGVARVAQADDRIGLSSLIYISFYPVARDFRKTDFFLAQRLQLFVGLDPRAFDEHLVGGVGYELTQGLNALFGWRFVTKQPVLAEGSGLQVGSPFDGPAESLPTRKRWETGSFFVGVGLSSDLIARLR